VEGIQIPVDAFSFIFSEYVAPPSPEDDSFSFCADEFRGFIQEQNLRLPAKESESFPLQSAITDRSTSPILPVGDILLHKYRQLSLCGKIFCSKRGSFGLSCCRQVANFILKRDLI
jgi:hypothetical protein